MAGVGALEVEEDIIGSLLGRRDAGDRHPIEGQEVVGHDAQPAAALGDHGTGVEAEDRVRGIHGRLDQRRRRVRVSQLEAPDAGKVEHRVQIAELRVDDVKEAPGTRLALLAARRRHGRRVLGRERRQEADGRLAVHLREAPRRLGDPQVVDREAALDQRLQLDARFEVRDVEHDRPFRVDDPQSVDGDRAWRVADQVGERAQAPGHAAQLQLAAILRQRALDEMAEARPLQDHRRRQHREDGQDQQSCDACDGDSDDPTDHFQRARPRHSRLSMCHSAPCAARKLG
jgi:hypothetical protein